MKLRKKKVISKKEVHCAMYCAMLHVYKQTRNSYNRSLLNLGRMTTVVSAETSLSSLCFGNIASVCVERASQGMSRKATDRHVLSISRLVAVTPDNLWNHNVL